MCISAVDFIVKGKKHEFADMLREIRNNEKPCSCFDRIHLEGEAMKQSNVLNNLKVVLGVPMNPNRYVFRMKLPNVNDCREKSDCGFIVSDQYPKCELLREVRYYANNRVHLLDQIRAENGELYKVAILTTDGGDSVRVPVN